MRALILVAGAALAVSACSSNEAAENTMNVDETLTTENVVANDTTAIDASTAMDANMTMDANAVDANAVVDANAATETTPSNGAWGRFGGPNGSERGCRFVRRPLFYGLIFAPSAGEGECSTGSLFWGQFTLSLIQNSIPCLASNCR